MAKKYPYSYTQTRTFKEKCPTCGLYTTMVQTVTTTEVSWFRGEDEVEKSEPKCAVCSGWKYVCKICGKVCYKENSLKDHIRMKHEQTKGA